MAREENAPELSSTIENIEADDVSRAVDRMTETDRHRKRTIRAVPAALVDSERHIAQLERAERWSHLASFVVATFAGLGFLGFCMEVWRTYAHGWP